MKIIHDPNRVQNAITKYHISRVFENTDLDFFIIEYEKGELIRSPLHNNELYQIVLTGTVSIFYIREDGTIFSIGHGTGHSHLGEFESFLDHDVPMYSEAKSATVTTLAFSIERYREQLLNDRTFMRFTIYNLADTIYKITDQEVSVAPLKERIANHIRYNCPDQILKGVESNAFLLCCSARQLQRVLNELVEEGQLKKIGKGTYAVKNPDFLTHTV